MTGNIERELARYDAEYEELDTESSWRALPDGEYRGEVVESCVEDGKYGIQYVIGLQVTEGEHEGDRITKWIGLDSEIGRGIAKRDTHTLGIGSEKLSDLPRLAVLAVGSRVRFRVQRKNTGQKTYTNIYLDEKLSGPTIEATAIDDSGGHW